MNMKLAFLYPTRREKEGRRNAPGAMVDEEQARGVLMNQKRKSAKSPRLTRQHSDETITLAESVRPRSGPAAATTSR